MFDISFYKGKRVLVTGHTGFKGAWMCEVLLHVGANVTGYALAPPTQPALFELLDLEERMHSVVGDVRDLERLKSVFEETQPEIVIHMAAQPIVRESYLNPVYTYDVNVMGTVNVLECIRSTNSVKSFVNVTTDKVYKNKEWEWGYRENEELNGYDPYSNSKSCSELITESYKNSFFYKRDVAVSTMRAGNVIGGGDFARDRIIPDCVRAAIAGRNIVIRNQYAVRPFQHVLEPIMAYLMVAARQYENGELAGNYNVGPDEKDCITVEELTKLFCKLWQSQTGYAIKFVCMHDSGLHEAGYLKLDCSKLKKYFGWDQRWDIKTALQMSVSMYCEIESAPTKVREYMEQQIKNYMKRI